MFSDNKKAAYGFPKKLRGGYPPLHKYYLTAADELSQHIGMLSIFSISMPLSNTMISSLSIASSLFSGYHLPMQI